MAKKRATPDRKKSDKQALLIDNIPKHSQQPRSSPPKRRTDFSSLLSYSSSFPDRDTFPRLSLNELGLLKFTMNQKNNTNEEPASTSLGKYSTSNREESPCSSPDEKNALGIELAACPLSDSLNKDVAKQKGTAQRSGLIPKKLQDSEGNGVSAENVQWSPECFEERSSNTTVEFLDQSYDKGSSSNSSRIGDNDLHLDRGRGKRERKPKVPFDEEVTFSIKSTRKMRRMKIMRYLGLAAPVGSPFSPIA